ncbi:conserved hypothetical protein [Agrobacterium sp. NCPPB 925]|nr:conserved hypothetical protein [Agrobacterium sp. NCPPB 925]
MHHEIHAVRGRSRAALVPFRSCETEQLPLLPGIPQIVLNPYNCQIEYIGFHISIMIY